MHGSARTQVWRINRASHSKGEQLIATLWWSASDGGAFVILVSQDGRVRIVHTESLELRLSLSLKGEFSWADLVKDTTAAAAFQ